MRIRTQVVALLGAAGWLASSGALQACATCFGVSDSQLAQGMTWGILSLLAIIASVLVGIALFFALIIRRAAHLADAACVAEPVPAAESMAERETAETLH